MIDARNEFELLIRARTPLIGIDSPEEERVDTLVTFVGRKLGLPVYNWTLHGGLVLRGGLKTAALYESKSVDKALDHLASIQRPALFFMKDLPHALERPEVVRRIVELARSFRADGRSLITAGAQLGWPDALQQHAALIRLSLPKDEELSQLVWRVVSDFSRGIDVQVALDANQFKQLVESLRGMTLAQAERVISKAVANDLTLAADDLEMVRDARKTVLSDGGAVEYVSLAAEEPTPGGVERLIEWLKLRRRALTPEGQAFGLPAPRGVLLLGVQGCGKSLLARHVARSWELPLLRLEPGRIFDKYIGESDKRFEAALDAAEHLAPCVLWIDEIEKGFASAGSAEADGGLARRIFGRLLGWLQEREKPVFVVATCNSVHELPPELMRKGRFDEIFFVDLPDPKARREILEAHLGLRNRDPNDFELGPVVEASAGFSGAELEEAIVSGLYHAFAAGRELDAELLLEAVSATRPLSVVRREEIEALRAWARERAVPAGIS